MKKKIGFAAAGVVVVAVLAFLVFGRGGQEKPQETGYLFDKTFEVKFEDAAHARGSVSRDMNASAQGSTPKDRLASVDASKYFTGETDVNPYTLKYFKYLTTLFKDAKNLDEALDLAREFIFSQLPPEEAERFFALYKSYLTTEIALMDAQKDWGTPTDADGIVALLHKIQEFRRERMGKDVADALWGSEMKIKEYAVRRGSIVNDDSLYGAEKMEAIRAVTEDMWGEDQAELVETYQKPYNRYQERLAIYERDFEEMTDEADKQALIHEFRNEFFTPEQVERLDEVDQQIAAEQAQEKNFEAKRQEIEADAKLTAEEKEKKVQDLATETFGEEGAAAYQRRTAIEEGRKKLMEKYGK